LSNPLLLRGARQLLTLRGDPCVRRGPQNGNLEVIEDGSVFIQGGKIVSVGTTRRLENLKEIRGALEVRVSHCIVMPGFVDPSMQLSLVQPYDRDGEAGKTQLKRRKLRDFYQQSLDLMRSCLAHGTLNAGIRASSGVRSLNADLSMLRQLGRIGDTPIGLMRIWCPDLDIHDEQQWKKTWESVSRQKLADAVALKMNHPALTAAHISLDWPGGSVKELRDRLEQLLPCSVFCHYDLSATERRTLAKSAATAVFKGGGLLDTLPIASVRELLDEGGAIALGSGYDALQEPNFNMQLVLALAVRRLNITIEQAIVATTINAAYAMNRGNRFGSLEPGKQADVLVLNLGDYREIPRRLGVNHVALAIRNGEVVMNRTDWKVGAV
jgi:imidazolonepropionase